MSEALLKRLVERFPDEVIETHTQHGDETAVLKRERLVEICTWLRDDPSNQLDLLRDVTAVDYLEMGRDPRFDVVYHLYSIPLKQALRLRVPVEQGDCALDSVVEVWPAANWAEREVWDMYGIRFANHPSLRRILLYEEFEGHPLRKDYPKLKSQPRLDLLQPERHPAVEYQRWEKGQSKAVEEDAS